MVGTIDVDINEVDVGSIDELVDLLFAYREMNSNGERRFRPSVRRRLRRVRYLPYGFPLWLFAKVGTLSTIDCNLLHCFVVKKCVTLN